VFFFFGEGIYFEKNFYRLPFTPPFSGSPIRSFKGVEGQRRQGEGLEEHADAEALAGGGAKDLGRW
jgi:hypothetical protein